MTENLPLRQCGGCENWRVDLATAKDGLIVAKCDHQSNQRDLDWRLASDTCRHWKKRKEK